MSWRDKVQAMRERLNCQNTPTPSLPKTTETLFVVSVSTPAPPIPKNQAAVNDPTPDPDRWCWLHSEALNGREIDTFNAAVNMSLPSQLENCTGKIMNTILMMTFSYAVREAARSLNITEKDCKILIFSGKIPIISDPAGLARTPCRRNLGRV